MDFDRYLMKSYEILWIFDMILMKSYGFRYRTKKGGEINNKKCVRQKKIEKAAIQPNNAIK